MQQMQQALAQEERQVSRHSLLASLLFPTCVLCLLECLGFNWYVLIGKDSPGCGHEHPSLVPKLYLHA